MIFEAYLKISLEDHISDWGLVDIWHVGVESIGVEYIV
jgi:hypothetical protein